MGNTGLQILDRGEGAYAHVWERVGGATGDATLQNEIYQRAGDVSFDQVNLKQFYKMCKAGDVILIRESVQITPNVVVAPGCARQIVAATTLGSFGGITNQQLPMWNRGGVVCLFEGAKALIEGTPTGIEVRPLKDILKTLRATKAVLALRSLRSPNKPFYASTLEPLIDICTSYRGLTWADILYDKRQAQLHANEPSGKSDVSMYEERDSQPLPIIRDPVDIVDAVLIGLKKQVLKVHPSMEYEALRCFATLDEKGSGELGLADAVKAIEMLCSSSSSALKDDSKVKDYMKQRGEQLLQKVVKTKKEVTTRRSKVGEISTVIRFEDFLEVFRELPLLYVPYQHDMQGILSGQVITAIYRYLRVLDENAQSPATLHIGNYSSLALSEVVLDLDHVFDREVICKTKGSA